MDQKEAGEILSEKMNELRRLSYPELCKFRDDVCVTEITGMSGAVYQLEIQAFWDDQPNHHLRVAVSIDDGGPRAIVPMSQDFIISPGGAFIGE